jgi:hypothetical protein
MASYVIGEVDDFIHEMEDHLRKDVICGGLEGEENDLDGIRWKECRFFKGFLIDGSQ